MTGDVVIRAEGLGKRYLIGHHAEDERYTALRDVIARGARGIVRSAADIMRGRPLSPAGSPSGSVWRACSRWAPASTPSSRVARTSI
jgi:lipopolysaccharide transport system ATP-binding protein